MSVVDTVNGSWVRRSGECGCAVRWDQLAVMLIFNDLSELRIRKWTRDCRDRRQIGGSYVAGLATAGVIFGSNEGLMGVLIGQGVDGLIERCGRRAQGQRSDE